MRVQIYFERLYAQNDTIISCDSTEIIEIVKSSYYVKKILPEDLELRFYSYIKYPGVYDIYYTTPKLAIKYIGTIFYEDSSLFNMPIFQQYVISSIDKLTIDINTYSQYLKFNEDYSWRPGKKISQLPHT